MMILTLSADKHISLVTEFFSPFFKINLLNTEDILNKNLKKTDLLLVRSVTCVNQQLIENTPIKFVASPNSGSDHLDINYLKKNNIAWSTAPGCNAQSVADYVVCCIAIALKKNLLSQKQLRAGIIGVGHVGSLIAKKLEILGFEILLNDPPRAALEKDFTSTPLDQFHDLDVICLHTPLTKTGEYPTLHLIKKEFLARQKKDALLISAGRGAVINFEDLKKFGRHLHWCIDVWENEPNIDLEILDHAVIATPHIAGHAIQSKWRGTQMIFNTIKTFFDLDEKQILPFEFPVKPPTLSLEDIQDWKDVVLKIYNPSLESIHMKKILTDSKNIAHDFELLRKNYPIRHELNFPILKIKNLSIENKTILQHMGYKFS